jgi:hypothetical protein
MIRLRWKSLTSAWIAQGETLQWHASRRSGPASTRAPQLYLCRTFSVTLCVKSDNLLESTEEASAARSLPSGPLASVILVSEAGTAHEPSLSFGCKGRGHFRGIVAPSRLSSPGSGKLGAVQSKSSGVHNCWERRHFGGASFVRPSHLLEIAVCTSLMDFDRAPPEQGGPARGQPRARSSRRPGSKEGRPPGRRARGALAEGAAGYPEDAACTPEGFGPHHGRPSEALRESQPPGPHSSRASPPWRRSAGT